MPDATHTFRLYLCSDFRDMRAEREYLHGVVFPELHRRLRRHLHRPCFEVVDLRRGAASEEEAEGEGGLKRALDEVERCRPWFLCLLGERAGPSLTSYPPELLEAYPWLGGLGGSLPSRLELEVLLGVLRQGMPAAGLVYLRHPSFLDRVPGPRAETFRGDGRARGLRTLLRDSGRAVLRAYRPRWDEAAGAVAGLEGFGEMVLADLELAFSAALLTGPASPARPLDEAIRTALAERDRTGRPDTSGRLGRPLAEVESPTVIAPAPAAAAPPPRPPCLDENVQFTVYRPRTVAPGQWYPLLAFAHLSERPPDAPPGTPDPVEEVARQASQVLGGQAKDYQDVTQDSRAAVPREGELTLVPEVPGVEFNPPRRSFLWQEAVHREEFRLRAAAALDGKTARGRLTVYLGHVILADVSLSFRVDGGHRLRPDEPPEAERVRPYRKIFGSYSHHDLHVVRQMEHLARALGDEYLRDWTHLRAGEVWDDRLLEMIRQADVFQLFWSSNSMRSPYCRREWEYALSLGRPHFVRPTYWEEPLPATPDGSLPPEALRRLHFQRLPVAELSPPTLVPGRPPVPRSALPVGAAPGPPASVPVRGPAAVPRAAPPRPACAAAPAAPSEEVCQAAPYRPRPARSAWLVWALLLLLLALAGAGAAYVLGLLRF